jgi:hemoglobin/transferrin/lactoferrin receptor protein
MRNKERRELVQFRLTNTTIFINDNSFKVILTIFLSLIYSLAFCQTASLKGKVTDSKTGEKIEGAGVFVSYNFITYTNTEGYFSITGLDEGKYQIKISHIGYKPFSGIINVKDITERDFTLESTPIEFDEVIVSTTRFDKYLRNSPYTELVQTRDKIEKEPFQSLPDALKKEPGISLIREGAWGTELNIRGLSRENVVALIDGNRIATSTDVAARFSLIDLNDVERIEIIEGASSSVYGSGATGGIVNIITKSPKYREYFSVNGNISTGYNTVNNSSISSLSLYSGGQFWSSKISTSYRKAGNIQTPIGELHNSQFEDYSLSGNLNVAPLINHTLKLNYQLFKANDVGIPGSTVFPSIADVRYPDERRELLSAGYEILNITPFFYKLSVKYAYQAIDRNVENIPHVVQEIAATSTTPARRVSILKITPEASHKNNNLQLQGNFLLNGNNNLVAGIDYRDRSYNGFRQKYQRIDILNEQNLVVSTVKKIIGEMPLPDSKYRSLGFFVQDDNELIKEKLSLSLGTRIDIINVKGEKTLNPVYEIVNGTVDYSPTGQQQIWEKTDVNDIAYSANMGLKYSLHNEVDLTLSLGYSFRSPSLEERFQYIDQGSYVLIGNPDLRSERGRSADFGIRYYLPDFKFISSFFFNYFTDLVTEQSGTFEDRPTYIKTNIGKARIYGINLRTDYNFYKNIVMYAVFSYVKGDDITKNSNLPEIPPLNGNLGLKFRLFDKFEFNLSSDIFTAQNKIAEGEITTPGYAVFNMSLNTEAINISTFKFKIFTGVENILDKNYRNHLSTLRGNITTEPGRNFYIKLSTGF